MSKSNANRPQTPVLRGIYQGIDFATAILLLTGQITTTGVFTLPGAISLSMSGPILGGTRLQGTSSASNLIIDGIDVITALLLIIGQFQVIGPFVGPQVLYIVVTGPPLGYGPQVPHNTFAQPSSTGQEFFRAFRKTVLEDIVLNQFD